jgi:uncharacterized protein (UPF0548 family)
MRIRFQHHPAHLRALLPEMRRRPLNFTSLDGLKERVVRREIPVRVEDLRELDLSCLERYHIFPPGLLRFWGEWKETGRTMETGDHIVLSASLPPGKWGLKAIFGVRVTSVWREPRTAGFTYATLAGHPERGVNSFSYTLDGGRPAAVITTRAGAGSWLSRSLWPVFTFPFVRYSNARALEGMATCLKEAAKSAGMTTI